jgi:hypothetical protein
MCPTNNDFLDELSDDDIMSIPPHILVHAMRTASQNGAQVVSPRQVPSAYTMGRAHNDASQPFLYTVGSEANSNFEWPVPDGHPPISAFMTEGRAVVKFGEPLARRTPASSEPVTYATSKISNPIHAAALKIKAVVDFQNREDIRGDPDELAVAYARLWGQPDDTFVTIGTVTMAHLTDLRKHAIATDTAFARYLGPIQDRRVISVAAGPTSPIAFGDAYSVDWTCMRVCVETKFALTASTEGYSLRELALPMAVGNYTADTRCTALMVYHPRTGVAWCHGERTFQVRVDGEMERAATPSVISVEMAKGNFRATVGDVMRAYRATVAWTLTAGRHDYSSTNVFQSAVNVVAHAMSSTRSVGRTSDKAIRAVMMDAFTSCSIHVRQLYIRAIAALTPVLRELALERAGEPITISCCKYLATRFQVLDGSVNASMTAAAHSRGEDSDDWYETLILRAPRALRDVKRGGYGWVVLAMYYMFKPPDEKWEGFVGAVCRVGIEAMGDVHTPLPSVEPENEQAMRDVVGLHCDAVARAKASMYGSAYMGVAKACFVLATAFHETDEDDLYYAFKVAGCFWVFRARCAESVRVNVVEPGTLVPIHGHHVDGSYGPGLGDKRVIATIAPYGHYRALVRGLHKLDVAQGVDYDVELVGRVSDAISGWGAYYDLEPAEYACGPDVYAAVVKSGMWRYLIDITRLGADIERFVSYAASDAHEAIRSIVDRWQVLERERRLDAWREVEALMSVAASGNTYHPGVSDVPDWGYAENRVADAIMEGRRVGESTGWDLIESLDPYEAEELMDRYAEDDMAAVGLLDDTYGDAHAFLMAVNASLLKTRKAATTANALV